MKKSIIIGKILDIKNVFTLIYENIKIGNISLFFVNSRVAVLKIIAYALLKKKIKNTVGFIIKEK